MRRLRYSLALQDLFPQCPIKSGCHSAALLSPTAQEKWPQQNHLASHRGDFLSQKAEQHEEQAEKVREDIDYQSKENKGPGHGI